MNDVEKYPIYIYRDDKLTKVGLYDLETMIIPIGQKWDFNHFVKKQVMKNQKNNYKRWEKYQRMILMPHQMNMDIEYMSPKGFEKKWNIPLYVVVFNKQMWLNDFYESEYFNSFYR